MRAAAAALLLEVVHQQLLRVLADYWQTEDIGRAGERRGGEATALGQAASTIASPHYSSHRVTTSGSFNISIFQHLRVASINI